LLATLPEPLIQTLFEVWPPGNAFTAVVLKNGLSPSPPVIDCSNWYLKEGSCFLECYIAIQKYIYRQERVGFASAITTALLPLASSNDLVVYQKGKNLDLLLPGIGPLQAFDRLIHSFSVEQGLWLWARLLPDRRGSEAGIDISRYLRSVGVGDGHPR
jgi:hypothetical protein